MLSFPAYDFVAFIRNVILFLIKFFLTLFTLVTGMQNTRKAIFSIFIVSFMGTTLKSDKLEIDVHINSKCTEIGFP